ncbi:MAG: LysM peptidoglycan-binding domain-containing protein [Bacteroidales bacterium]|nr:LysM peptidoglycan-binding domain-containing protein [Bacteroidales bacterium]MDD2425821.1 LysM peptidoglycan-binding domain-containing protein [Bacteroidales bacterium]MDD3988841.1 LysM peptidoglycan-binding domain-containing protein [Bacteroidales bacterium]
MKRLIPALFLILLFLSPLNGQNNPGIQVSSDTVRVDGKLFYRHKVQKGETIFSLCRAYKIDAEELVKDNPKLREGLKEGDLLQIKKSESHPKKYVKYIVKWFDNLQTIADQFNISPKEIMALNSLSEPKVKTRQELMIPYKEEGELKSKPINDQRVQKIKEQKAQRINEQKTQKTIEQKAQRINEQKDQKTIEEKAQKINEQITNQKSEQIKEEIDETVNREEKQESSRVILHPPVLPVKSGTIEENISPPEGFVEREATVSLILPFSQPEIEEPYAGNNYLDFYQGFLIASREMKEAGMSLNLNVYDTGDYPDGTVLLQTGALDNSDLIIGPVFLDKIEEIIGFSTENGIPLVSPMDPRSEYLAADNPLFFQVGISLYNQQANLLKSLSRSSQITLIYEEEGSDSSLISVSKKILDKLAVKYSSLSYNLLSGREMGPKIESRLSDSRLNEVVVLSNSEAFVSDVLRNLNLLSSRNGYKISLYGTPRWRNFDNVDIAYYHSMNLHLSLQYYVDYESYEVESFLEQYRSYFASEPSPYSFQGYDLGRFFLNNMFRHGSRFIRRIEGNREVLLQSDLRFRREGRGFINSESRLVIYNPDFSVQISRFYRQP